jgi:2-(3-amino-3-carboxypropyl)histidine synthase
MRLAKRRAAAVAEASKAKSIGVLVSSKPGQMALGEGKDLSKRLRNRGIDAFVIYLDEVRADALNNFTEPNAFIDTACPRIAIDGVAGVERPIITTVEARVVTGEARWEDIWGPVYLG